MNTSFLTGATDRLIAAALPFVAAFSGTMHMDPLRRAAPLRVAGEDDMPDYLTVAFFVGALSLWPPGAWLFAHSGLSRTRKASWTVLLLAVGGVVGFTLPLPAIAWRFLILAAMLPALALIDIRLARSNRTFGFWFRACSFEISTVFLAAALVRLAWGGR